MKIIKLILILFCFLFVGQKVYSQATDYRVHAMFIFYFTRYIDWPESKKTGDFIIGVYGKSAVLPELMKVAASRKVGNQNIVVKQLDSYEEAANCHMVFIAESKIASYKNVHAVTEYEAVILITEMRDFGKKAGINFLIQDEKLKFQINSEGLESKGLKLSKDIMKLAI